MKIKLDENVSAEAKHMLAALGHDVDTVASEGLTGRLDLDILSEAIRQDRLLITQDIDFSDARRYKPGAHRGIILLRHRSRGRGALLRRVEQIATRSDFASWTSCFVVVTDVKVRVRRLVGH